MIKALLPFAVSVAVLAVAACDAPTQSAADAKATKLTVQDAKATWDGIIVAGGMCDTATSEAARSAKGGDIFEMYRVLKEGKDACMQSVQAIERVQPPESASGEVKDAFKTALEACHMAYVERWAAMDKMMTVVNGDQRPSSVNEVRETMGEAQAEMLRCSAGYMVAVNKAGIDPTLVFGKPESKSQPRKKHKRPAKSEDALGPKPEPAG